MLRSAAISAEFFVRRINYSLSNILNITLREMKSAYTTIIVSGGFVFFALGALAIRVTHLVDLAVWFCRTSQVRHDPHRMPADNNRIQIFENRELRVVVCSCWLGSVVFISWKSIAGVEV